jgi:hypothetical protein
MTEVRSPEDNAEFIEPTVGVQMGVRNTCPNALTGFT